MANIFLSLFLSKCSIEIRSPEHPGTAIKRSYQRGGHVVEVLAIRVSTIAVSPKKKKSER